MHLGGQPSVCFAAGESSVDTQFENEEEQARRESGSATRRPAKKKKGQDDVLLEYHPSLGDWQFVNKKRWLNHLKNTFDQLCDGDRRRPGEEFFSWNKDQRMRRVGNSGWGRAAAPTDHHSTTSGASMSSAETVAPPPMTWKELFDNDRTAEHHRNYRKPPTPNLPTSGEFGGGGSGQGTTPTARAAGSVSSPLNGSLAFQPSTRGRQGGGALPESTSDQSLVSFSFPPKPHVELSPSAAASSPPSSAATKNVKNLTVPQLSKMFHSAQHLRDLTLMDGEMQALNRCAQREHEIRKRAELREQERVEEEEKKKWQDERERIMQARYSQLRQQQQKSSASPAISPPTNGVVPQANDSLVTPPQTSLSPSPGRRRAGVVGLPDDGQQATSSPRLTLMDEKRQQLKKEKLIIKMQELQQQLIDDEHDVTLDDPILSPKRTRQEIKEAKAKALEERKLQAAALIRSIMRGTLTRAEPRLLSHLSGRFFPMTCFEQMLKLEEERARKKGIRVLRVETPIPKFFMGIQRKSGGGTAETTADGSLANSAVTSGTFEAGAAQTDSNSTNGGGAKRRLPPFQHTTTHFSREKIDDMVEAYNREARQRLMESRQRVVTSSTVGAASASASVGSPL